MPCSFRCFLRTLSTICRMACECCWNCCHCCRNCCPAFRQAFCRAFCRAFCSFVCSCFPCRLRGNRENGRLLAYSTNATASFQTRLCRNILDSFSQIYLSSTRQSLHWDTSNAINSKAVVICAKISRLQDDINATLNRLNIMGKPKIMLVVIHACEPGVTPENLLTNLPDDRVTSFTNVLYSESTEACYDCLTNREADAAIKRFIK